MSESKYDVPVDFVAGSLGATASVYVGQPLDTLKVTSGDLRIIVLYPNNVLLRLRCRHFLSCIPISQHVSDKH